LFTANGHALTNLEHVSSLESRQAPAVFRNREAMGDSSTRALARRLYRGAAFGDLNHDNIDMVITRLGEPPA
jgi:hypothetical protein